MAEIRTDQLLLPSVLDRLIDHDPQTRQEAPRTRNQLLRDLKQAVRRDLENLLNTRVRCVPFPPGLSELKQSLVNYGIPDLTGASLGSAKDREEFRRTIEAVIRMYEPRLRDDPRHKEDPRHKKLSVTILDHEAIDRTIRFHIEATLLAEPAPEPVAFDSMLRLTTGTFEVKGESDGG
jgi:type VI secretion system protein ImpF